MKASPLNLHDYYVTELFVSASKTFDIQKPVKLAFEDLSVDRQLIRREDKKDRPWQLTMRVHLAAAPEKNAPYQVTLELVGFFDVAPEYTADIETLIKVTGGSMLFGAARQVIRSATGQGPYFPLLLPSVSFYPPKQTPPPADKK